jgi:DNA helicase-2/ATP-dependent DNA helicase PcrA
VLATHCEAADVGTGDHPANGKSAPRGTDAAVLDFVALARRRLAAAKVASGKRAGGFGGDSGGRHRGRGLASATAGFGPYAGACDEGDEEEEPDPVGTAVSGQLREWRRRLARASGVPPHVLMHDATVEAVAARRPANAQELVAVPGLGPVKVARYGPAILEVVREAVAGAAG